MVILNKKIHSMVIAMLICLNFQETNAMRRAVIVKIAAPFLIAQQTLNPYVTAIKLETLRHLLPGQENNPHWIAANQDVEQFKAQTNLPSLPPAAIENGIKFLESRDEKTKNAPPLRPDAAKQQRMIAFKQEIISLLKKHELNPELIDIRFVQPEDKNLSFATRGKSILINYEKFDMYPEEFRTAAIEHEIGHLITHDHLYLTVARIVFAKDPNLYKEYLLLVEKRADIHSMIQSEKNTRALIKCSGNLGYGFALKKHSLVQKIKKLAPDILSNHALIALTTQDPVDQMISQQASKITTQPHEDPMIFEKTKEVTIQDYKKGKISLQALQEITALCDKPTYMQDLLDYHTQQKH